MSNVRKSRSTLPLDFYGAIVGDKKVVGFMRKPWNLVATHPAYTPICKGCLELHKKGKPARLKAAVVAGLKPWAEAHIAATIAWLRHARMTLTPLSLLSLPLLRNLSHEIGCSRSNSSILNIQNTWMSYITDFVANQTLQALLC